MPHLRSMALSAMAIILLVLAAVGTLLLGLCVLPVAVWRERRA